MFLKILMMTCWELWFNPSFALHMWNILMCIYCETYVHIHWFCKVDDQCENIAMPFENMNKKITIESKNYDNI